MNSSCAICTLHWLMQQQNRACPEFEIIPPGDESGSEIFYCRVTADKVIGVGVARTKSKAAYEAAECALSLLRFTGQLRSTSPGESVCSLGSIMRDKKLTKEALWKDISGWDEPNLSKLLTKLDLTYSLNVTRNNDKTIVFISINSQPKISMTLIAKTIEEARQKLVYKCFEFLQTLTK